MNPALRPNVRDSSARLFTGSPSRHRVSLLVCVYACLWQSVCLGSGTSALPCRPVEGLPSVGPPGWIRIVLEAQLPLASFLPLRPLGATPSTAVFTTMHECHRRADVSASWKVFRVPGRGCSSSAASSEDRNCHKSDPIVRSQSNRMNRGSWRSLAFGRPIPGWHPGQR